MTRIHKHATLSQLISPGYKKLKPVDKLTLIAAVIEPLFMYPQAIQIFRYKTALGVSIPTWLGIDILTIVWIWYAVVHKQKMIFIYQGLFFIAITMTLVGALEYGGKWF